MKRIHRTSGILLATLAVLACERSDVRESADDAAGGDAARARYSRQMIFIADDATGAAVLDFTATDARSAVRRTARAWAEAGSGWTPLYDLAWEGASVRRPWRLVPNGPIRLRVGINDEVEAITVRDGEEDLASLETGDFIAEWAPSGTSQLLLRQATLSLGAEPMSGWLVDARFGVAPHLESDTGSGNAFVPNGDAAATNDQAAGATDTGADSTGVAEPDTSTPPAPDPYVLQPGAIAVRALRGVLVDDEGATLVIGETAGGLGGWLWTEDGESTFATVTLTMVAGDREGWSITGNGDAPLSGTLTVMDEEPLPVSPRIVRGTVRIGDAELEMHGVLRRE